MKQKTQIEHPPRETGKRKKEVSPGAGCGQKPHLAEWQTEGGKEEAGGAPFRAGKKTTTPQELNESWVYTGGLIHDRGEKPTPPHPPKTKPIKPEA